MGTPNVTIRKSNGNTGAVAPGAAGVLAILAASQSMTKNQPAPFSRQADVITAGALGPLAEYAAYYFNEAGLPILAIAPSTSTAATIYGQGQVEGGTSVPTWETTPGSAVPIADEFHMVVTITNDGNGGAGTTVGTTGILYTVSFDGGQTVSSVLALGTATRIDFVAPVVGLPTGLSLAFGAGTLKTGDTFYCYTTRPQPSNADLVGALEALRVSKAPWDNLLVDGDCSAATVATVDAWLQGLNASGVFKMAWMNTRHKSRPVPTTESEAAYLAYLGTLLASTSSINVDVGADGAELPSPITGNMQPRPTSLFVATRAESIPIGVDPAELDLGPLGGGLSITDTKGNPTWHDEQLYPGLDGLRLSTLRSVPGQVGVFITNANLLYPTNSDFIYDQHARVMNAACALAYTRLQTKLSKGVRKQPPNPTTGAIYILENDAQAIEADVNAQFRARLKGQCNAAAFQLSRNDDLSPNSGATVNGEVQIEALAYIKNFSITAKFVKSITVPTAGA